MDERRLSDLIISAHRQACEEGKTDVAHLLIEALQHDLSAIGGPNAVDGRESTADLEAAFDLHEQTFGKF